MILRSNIAYSFYSTSCILICWFFVVVVAPNASAASATGLLSSQTRMTRPILRQHRFPIRQSQSTQPWKGSSVKRKSKYIWYASRPLPSELNHRVLRNLSVVSIPPSKPQNQTKMKPAPHYYYYFLSDLNSEELSQYSKFIAKNSKAMLNWNHQARISRKSTGPYVHDTETTYETVAPNVNMYIIDSGIDKSHPEFIHNKPRAFTFAEDEEEDESDCIGHGTHVASLALGDKYGIARQANLISLKTCDCNGESDVESIMKAIQFAMKDAQDLSRETGKIVPSVINLSLGIEYNAALDSILSLATQQEGMYIFTSAGNDNQDACQDGIARSTFVITVAATDAMDRRSHFSNFGPCVDVYAPGEKLLAAVPLRQNPTGKTVYSGTSMASPVAAGVLAVYLSKFGHQRGYRLFEEQLLHGIVKQNPFGTRNKFVYMNPDFF